MITAATYQGKPCQHGHGATRYKANYKCVTCARADQAARYDKATATARKRAYRAKLPPAPPEFNPFYPSES